jgi:rubrerythrin
MHGIPLDLNALLVEQMEERCVVIRCSRCGRLTIDIEPGTKLCPTCVDKELEC